MVLVGPSGCGKTTALRMVAGLEDITSGILRIGGKEANDETPKERDIAMVFQNYALYPHMTVAQNIGFALKLRKLPKDQLDAKVEAMTMGDRVTVMRDGTLQQVAPPQTLYDNPDNIFVAAFIGSPAQNLYDAVVGEGARSLKLGSQEIGLPEAVLLKRPALRSYAGKDVVVGMRPEHLRAEADGAAGPKLVGE